MTAPLDRRALLILLTSLAACALPNPRSVPSPVGRLHRYRVDGRPLTLYRRTADILESLGTDAQGRAIHGIVALDPATGQIVRASFGRLLPCTPRKPYLSITRLEASRNLDVARVEENGMLHRTILPLPPGRWFLADLALAGLTDRIGLEAPMLHLGSEPGFTALPAPLRFDAAGGVLVAAGDLVRLEEEKSLAPDQWKAMIAAAMPC